MQHIIIPQSDEKVVVLALGLPSQVQLKDQEAAEIAAFWLTRKNIDPIYSLQQLFLETEDKILCEMVEGWPKQQVVLFEIPHSQLKSAVLSDGFYICQP